MINECQYHLCDKVQVRVHKCKHCGKYFCKEHLNPRKPSAAPFKSTDPLKQLEWSEDGGHPCPDYVDYLSETRIEETEKQLNSLDRMNVFSPRYEIPSYQPTYTIGESISEHKPDKSKSILKSEIDGSAIDNTFEELPQNKETDIEGDTDSSYKSEKKLETNNVKTKKSFKTKSNSYKAGTKNKKPSKLKHTVNKYSYDLKKWFFRRNNPYSKLRKEDFLIHLGLIIGLSLIFWVIYSNKDSLNDIILLIFKLGSLIELIVLIIILRSVYKLAKNLKKGWSGTNNGVKLSASLILIFLCLGIYQNPMNIISPITEFEYDSLNPIQFNSTALISGFDEVIGPSVLSPSEIRNHPEKYMGKNITVHGIYVNVWGMGHLIFPLDYQSNPNANIESIPAEFQNDIECYDGAEYYFTGILEKDEYNKIPKLVVSNVEST